MNHRVAFVAAFLLFGFVGSFAIAQDEEGVKISPADVEAYLKVQNERELLSAREIYARGKEGREKLKAARENVLKNAGFTDERFEEVSSTISTIAEALQQLERGGDDAAVAKDTLSSQNKQSIAAVKAKLKEITDNEGRGQRAQAQAKEEHDGQRRGAPPTPEQLAGTWKFDADATVEAIAGSMDDETKKKMRDDLTKSSGQTVYTFGPGDAISSTAAKPDGSLGTDKGTYRLDGNLLFIKGPGSNTEHKLTVGIKGDHLIISAFGVPTYYRKG